MPERLPAARQVLDKCCVQLQRLATDPNLALEDDEIAAMVEHYAKKLDLVLGKADGDTARALLSLARERKAGGLVVKRLPAWKSAVDALEARCMAVREEDLAAGFRA